MSMKISKTSPGHITAPDKHSIPTFKKPVGVTFFGAVWLEEREDVLGNVFNHPGGKSRILQVGDVLRFYHFIFLRIKKIKMIKQTKDF